MVRATACGRSVVAVGIVIGCASALIFWDPLVNGDSLWLLVWGEQLARGDLTTFTPGPTPHPLPIALGAVTSALGERGNYVATYLLFGPAALGALAAAAFAIVQRLYAWWAGGVAVALLVTSPSVVQNAASAGYDVAFAALVVAALAIGLARPGGGVAPLALLTVAGLLRPEAWLLAGLCWLWLYRAASPRRRIATAILVAAAPVVWAVMDLAVTGDPLYSLHATDEASERFRAYSVPDNLAEGARNLVGAAGPLTLLPAVGYVWWVARERSRSSVPLLTVLAVMLGVFVLLVTQGLASSERYLLLPACLLIVLAALGLGRASSRPVLVGAGFVLIAIQVAGRLDAPLEVRSDYASYLELERQTAELVQQEPVRQLLASCEDVSLPSNRMIPTLAYYSGRDPARFYQDAEARRTPDVFVAPGSATAATSVLTRRRFDDDPTFGVPEGVVPRYRTRDWQLFVATASPCVVGG